MQEPEELLVFNGVDKSFGHQKSLHNVSFNLSEGEYGALVGPPRSGKTTILRLAAGVDASNQGSILFEGSDIREDGASSQTRIGTVLGDTGLDRSRSVRSNLRFAADIYGVPAGPAEARMDALLARFHLTANARDNVGSLGEIGQRLIAIAQATLHGPRLLLVDAVADNLEPGARRELAERVAGLCIDENIAILWATEHADDAATAGKLIVLERAQVLFDGSPATLLGDAGHDSLSAAISILGERQATQSDGIIGA